MTEILGFLKDTFLDEFQTTMTGDRIASGLLVSFFLALLLVAVYKITYLGVSFSRSYAFSLILASMVTSVIIMTVTTNLTLSLGMVGALSIVRFRTAVKEPADTVFMFWSVCIGIMAGAGLVYIAFITNIALALIFLSAFYIAGKKKRSAYMLLIRYSKDGDKAVEAALGAFGKMRVRSRSVSDGVIEVAISVSLDEKTLRLVDSLSEIEGVISASAVSYNGDTSL